MIVADTDVLIDFLSNSGLAERVALELENGSLATTAITRFELLSGTRSPRQKKIALELLDGLATLALDQVAADEAATVRRSLEERGEGIGMADSLIAGIVRVHGAMLLTRNQRHFGRVEGLVLAERSEGNPK